MIIVNPHRQKHGLNTHNQYWNKPQKLIGTPGSNVVPVRFRDLLMRIYGIYSTKIYNINFGDNFGKYSKFQNVIFEYKIENTFDQKN